MKTEAAIQQILTEFNRQHGDGQTMEIINRHEALGQLIDSFRQVERSLIHDTRAADQRSALKQLAANAMKAMVDIT